MKINTYQEAIDKVFTFEQITDYSIEKMHKAVMLLGDPLKDIKVIHIAGTNGKGSVSKMVFSVLKQAGKKVGCYTSPHLVDIRERFQTDSGLISEKEFVECVNRIFELELAFSYFEKAVLIGFLLFQKREVEYAVIEVGCGGLLDSTNVVEPYITAITSIGYDHMKLLGNSLEEISFQKAGIIKSGVPVVYNHENKVIAKIAEEKNAPVIFTEKKVQTNLVGEYQEKNAGIAYEVCKYIGCEEKYIFNGLQKVEHFGRLQFIAKNILVDGAHNEQGLKELHRYIKSIENNFKEINLCIAQKKGKTGDTILKEFFPEYNKYILVSSENVVIVEEAKILKDNLLFQETSLTINCMSVEEITSLSQENTGTLYIIFGSLYMIGEFYKFDES